MAVVQMATQPWGYIVDANGNPMPNTTVTIENLDASPATHYASVTRTSPLSSTLTTDVSGLLTRFIDSGTYNMTVGGTTRRVEASSGSLLGRVTTATGDGATDDTAALRNDHAAAILLGTHILLTPGTYRVSGRIHTSGTTTATVRFVALVPGTVTIERTADVPIIEVVGTRGTSQALSANATAGDQSVTVAALPSGLVAGDYLQIRSTTTLSTESNTAEVVRVLSTSGAGPYTINLAGPLEESYLTAATAVIEKLNFAGVGSRLSGIKFRQTAVNRDTSANPLVRFTLARNVRIDDLELRDADAPGIELRSSIDVSVRRSHFEDLTDDLANNRIGYGVNIAENCRDIRIIEPTGRRVRHVITTNGDAGGLTNGAPRHVLVSHGQAWETTGGAWNTHKGGKFITFAYCSEHNSKSTPFYIRSPLTTLIEPIAVFPAGDGVAFAESECDDGRVIGGRLTGSGTANNPLLVTGRNVRVDGTLVERSASGRANVEVQGVETKLIKLHSRNPGTINHLNFTGSLGDANLVDGGYFQATSTTALANVAASTTVRARAIRGVNLNSTWLVGGAAGTLITAGNEKILGPTWAGWSAGTAALSSNVAYFFRIKTDREVKVGTVAFHVQTASGTDDPHEIAIYNSTLTSKLATTGALTGKLNSTGRKTATLTYTLEADTEYYVAFAATSTATLYTAGISTFNIANLLGTAAPSLPIASRNTSYPLPSDASSATGASNAPLLALLLA